MKTKNERMKNIVYKLTIFGIVGWGVLTGYGGLTQKLSNLVFPKLEDKAVKTLNIDKNKLYKTPSGNYFTSEDNLSELFMLAGYDAGTVGKGKSGYFDPNTQQGELKRTCIETDYNGDHILTESEINKRLKNEYDWDPKPF